MRWSIGAGIVITISIAIFGLPPYSTFNDANTVTAEGYSKHETGVSRQSNGVYLVRALTRMPGVKAHMIRWWFSDYMQTTEHYKRWHPTAHVWMDWENKKPGEIVGASHLVHEYIGKDLNKLRIQFVEPSAFLGPIDEHEDQFIVCARAGELETPINLSSMCHIVRNTEWGAEMRSIFWLGHVARREGNGEVISLEGLVGNTALARFLLVDEQFAVDLMTHAIEEMGYLADFLPQLYLGETGKSQE